MKRNIIRILTGSRLYGVAEPTSDYDIKSVFVVNSIADFYDGFDQFIVSNNGLEGSKREEYEEFYIKQFSKLLCSGQTVALDMLFAPEKYWISNTRYFELEWVNLTKNKDKLISKNVFPFVRYARSQAVKYSIKGEKLNTLKDFVADIFDALVLDGDPKEWFPALSALYKDREGIRLWEHTRDGVVTPMIEVCGKSFGRDTNVKLWLQPLQNLIDQFGERSEAAMMSNGKDLKAMYHSIRIVDQCIELLKDNTITFPRPNADYLLAIRQGKHDLASISKEIDSKIELMDSLIESSTLPEKPDEEFIRSWARSCQLEKFGIEIN